MARSCVEAWGREVVGLSRIGGFNMERLNNLGKLSPRLHKSLTPWGRKLTRTLYKYMMFEPAQENGKHVYCKLCGNVYLWRRNNAGNFESCVLIGKDYEIRGLKPWE